MIPDDYLKNKSLLFLGLVMVLGIGYLIRSLPIKKEKYPNSKVYVPSKNYYKNYLTLNIITLMLYLIIIHTWMILSIVLVVKCFMTITEYMIKTILMFHL